MSASARARILLWAAIVALLCGVTDVGEPIDRLLRTARDAVRAQSASGSVVVIKVDNRSLRSMSSWGARRSVDAQALDTLFALGARRVLFDKVYSDPSPVGDDAVFAAALARHRGRVFLATRFEQDRATGRREWLHPTEALRKVVDLGSINVLRNFLGYTSRVPYQTELGGVRYRSFSAILADVRENPAADFLPDYSIRYWTVPSISMIDVLHGNPAARVVRGKDVIVGSTTDTMGDTHVVPGQGAIPGVYIHAIGADTLRHHVPREPGWMPLYVVALLTAFAYLSIANARVRHWSAVAGYVSLILASLVFDAWNVHVTVVPAAVLLGIVVIRARILVRMVSNPVTGLPMLDRLARDGSTCPETIVGLKIGNYADLRAALNDEEERALFAEVVRRLRVGGDAIEITHADGSLIWKTALGVGTQLFDHVAGLHALMAAPIDVGGRVVDLTVGFGIEGSVERPLTNRVGSALMSAEDAVAAGARWCVHDSRTLEDAEFRLALPSRIDLAIADREIWVAYQAKLDLRTRRLCGAEALVRWSHPTRGLIPPDQFIPTIEQANRISGLTFFVLESAIRDARRIDPIDPEFSVAVNLSVRMLSYPGVVEKVADLLDVYKLAPRRLTLEITESAEIDAAGRDLMTLHALRDLGVRISIDDYGTKYSTLDYVRQLPASEIKIDQRFIRALNDDESARIMARSTVELAHSLGLTVVAEGVETPDILVTLSDMGCDVVQGFLIARPVPFADLHRSVADARSGIAA